MKGTTPLIGRKRPAESKNSFSSPSQLTLSVVHFLFALSLLIAIATTPTARIILLLFTATIEFVVRLCGARTFSGSKKLIVYIGLFVLEYLILARCNLLTTPRELEIRGLPVPAKSKSFCNVEIAT